MSFPIMTVTGWDYGTQRALLRLSIESHGQLRAMDSAATRQGLYADV